MQQVLEDGGIDMVTSPRKTPEREEKFDFSRPIGTNAEDVQASLDAGMNAHLSKPIVMDEVIKTILRYVR